MVERNSAVANVRRVCRESSVYQSAGKERRALETCLRMGDNVAGCGSEINYRIANTFEKSGMIFA